MIISLLNSFFYLLNKLLITNYMTTFLFIAIEKEKLCIKFKIKNFIDAK